MDHHHQHGAIEPALMCVISNYVESETLVGEELAKFSVVCAIFSEPNRERERLCLIGDDGSSTIKLATVLAEIEDFPCSEIDRTVAQSMTNLTFFYWPGPNMYLVLACE